MLRVTLIGQITIWTPVSKAKGRVCVNECVRIQACCHVLAKRPPGDDEGWKVLRQQTQTYPSQKFIGKGTELDWVQMSHRPWEIPINSLSSDRGRHPLTNRFFFLSLCKKRGDDSAQGEMDSVELPGLFLVCCIRAWMLGPPKRTESAQL